MTPSGIESATFRFVAQHLNHCATAVPSSAYSAVKYHLQLKYLQTNGLTALNSNASGMYDIHRAMHRNILP